MGFRRGGKEGVGRGKGEVRDSREIDELVRKRESDEKGCKEDAEKG